MADTFTTNLNLTKPEPGAAEDTWGISLNSDLDTLDAIFSSSGTQVNLNPNQVNFADNKKAIFGTGNDLQIYHNGSASYIDDTGTGPLYLKGNAITAVNLSDAVMFTAIGGNKVGLNYNGNEKLATTSTGIDVTGTVTSDGVNTDGNVVIDGLLQFEDSGGSNRTVIEYDSNDDVLIKTGTSSGSRSIRFQTEASEAARIDSSGNLLVGTTTNNVGSEGVVLRERGDVRAVRSGGTAGVFNRLTSDGGVVSFQKDGTTVGTIGTNSGYIRIGTGDTHLLYHSGIDTIIPYSGSANRDDAISLGYSGARFKDLHLSGTANIGSTTSVYEGAGGDAFFKNTNSGADLFLDSGRRIRFTANGSERARIDSSGFVGIGTTSPQKALNVFANNSAPVRFERNTSDGQVIQIYKDGSAVSSIGTNSIGIGTSLPSATLDIVAASTNAVKISRADGNAVELLIESQNGDNVVTFSDGGTDKWSIGKDNTDSSFRLAQGGTLGVNDAIVVNSSRNVGIGLTSLTEKFEVNGSINTSNQSSNFNTGTYRTFMDMINSAKIARIGTLKGANTPTGTQGSIYFTVNGTTQAILNEVGYLGLGGITPARNLHVHASNFTDLHLTNDTTGVTASDGTSFTAIGSDIYLTNREAGNMVFQTSGTERARIDSSGNFLIGKTSANIATVGFEATPSSIFQANASTADGKVAHTFNRKTSDGDVITFRKDDSTVGSIGAYVGYPYIGKGDTTLLFNPDGDRIIPRGTNAGQRDAAIDLGGTSDRFKDLHLSGTANVGSVTASSTAFTSINIDSSRASGNIGGVNFRDSSDTIKGQIYGLVDGQVKINHNSNVTTFDNNGALLVGKTADSFSVAGATLNSGGTAGKVQFVRSGEQPLALNRLTNNGVILGLYQGGTEAGRVGSYAGLLYLGKGDTTLLFDDANDHIVPRGTDGGARDNVINLGSSSNRFNDLHLGGTGYFGTSVGIGTSSPSNTLHIQSASATGAILNLETTHPSGIPIYSMKGAHSAQLRYQDENGNNQSRIDFLDGGDFNFIDASSGTSHMKINSSGNVGIGTTSPDAPLTIHNSSDPEIRFGYSSTQDHKIAWDSSKVFIHADPENANGSSALGFAVDGSERARIDANGYLIVNKTSSGISTAGALLSSVGSHITRDGGSPLSLNRLTSDGAILNIRRDGTLKGNIGVVDNANGAQIVVAAGPSGTNTGVGLRFVSFTNPQITPCYDDGSGNDNSIDLGAAGVRFDDIYATNGTIQTSDRNEKQDIQELSDAEQRVATACKGLIRRYKFNKAVTEKGDDARYHFGIIAQDLQDAFASEGLDAGDYGMFISSTYTDDNGIEQTRLGVRYNELLAFIIATL